MRTCLYAWTAALVICLAGQCLAQAQPATQPVKVVCFGDSVTGQVSNRSNLDKALHWPELLQLMLEARLGEGVVVHNRGQARDSTYPKPDQGVRGGVTRFATEVIDERPGIVVILFGGNDAHETAEQQKVTFDNLKRMVEAAKDARIKVLLLQYAKLPAEGKPGGIPVNAVIAEVAKATDTPLLALQPAFDRALKAQPRRELVNENDGVHLAPGGEMVVARSVCAKLVEMGWIK